MLSNYSLETCGSGKKVQIRLITNKLDKKSASDVSWTGYHGVQKSLESSCLWCQRSLLRTRSHNRIWPYSYTSLSTPLNAISTPPIIHFSPLMLPLLALRDDGEKRRVNVAKTWDVLEHFTRVWSSSSVVFPDWTHTHIPKRIPAGIRFFCRSFCWPHGSKTKIMQHWEMNTLPDRE